ncbi:MAG: DEAD/DEAH box helicase [Candidatus Woesearchaeota archaeon]
MKLRAYQKSILDACKNNNTLVVLPTGLGKTAIALSLAKERLETYKGSKVLFLAPTKPLAQQHEVSANSFFDYKVSLFTGSVKPEKREELWKDSDFIISTPQGLENDIINKRIDLRDVSLIVFDEAHRATGDYAYVFIAKKYVEDSNYQKILALTASPGSSKEKILEVSHNLFIEHVEYRSKDSGDVLPYVQEVDNTFIEVELSDDLKRLRMFLNNCYESKLKDMEGLGVVKGVFNYSKTGLLKLMGELHGKVSRGEKDFEVLKSISLLAEALKIQHALELVETQTVYSVYSYLKDLKREAEVGRAKAVKNLVRDINFRSAFVLARVLHEKGVTHPKLERLVEIVKEELSLNKDIKIIIFSQFRDTAVKIKDILNLKSEIFVGQAKKKNTGLSQKKQKAMIEDFSNGKFNCLIATSVGEEGLDIPEVNLVVFYEPIPSAIRTVQRRGRTGRHSTGKVITLIAKGTRDEAYRWSAFHKEKKMYSNLKDINSVLKPREQQEVLKVDEDKQVKIKVDYREKGSYLVKELLNQGVDISLENLPVGDFILSDDVVVEFKNVPDFVDSIIDGRILSQVRDLKQYKKPLIILQGDEDVYSQRKIHPNAIRGLISSVSINFGVPIIRTLNPKDTVDYLKVIASKEQLEKKDFQMHTSKPLSLKAMQEYVVSSFPGIGSTLSRPLLKEFKSVKNIVNAKKEDLKNVDLIGDKKADALLELFDSEYEDD